MGLSNSLPDSIIQPGVCTSSTRPGNPYIGQVIFETDTLLLAYWNGTWTTLDSRYLPLTPWTDVAAGAVVLNQFTVCPKTIEYAAHQKLGTTCRWQGAATITGAGGTAGNPVAIGLPFTMRTVAYDAGIRPIGTIIIYDTSAAAYYRGLIIPQPPGTFVQAISTHTTSANYLGAIEFTAALAAGDRVCWDMTYETA